VDGTLKFGAESWRRSVVIFGHMVHAFEAVSFGLLLGFSDGRKCIAKCNIRLSAHSHAEKNMDLGFRVVTVNIKAAFAFPDHIIHTHLLSPRF